MSWRTWRLSAVESHCNLYSSCSCQMAKQGDEMLLTAITGGEMLLTAMTGGEMLLTVITGGEMLLTAITTFANWSNSDICEWKMLNEK